MFCLFFKYEIDFGLLEATDGQDMLMICSISSIILPMSFLSLSSKFNFEYSFSCVTDQNSSKAVLDNRLLNHSYYCQW